MTKEGWKKCTGKCGEWKPANTEHFYRNPNTKDGLQSRCIICNNQASARSKSKRKRKIWNTYSI